MATPALRFSSVLARPTPAIAVTFTDASAEIEHARSLGDGLDVAELRIDRFGSHDSGHVVEHARSFRALFPTIGTIRSAAEGGAWTATESERLALFLAVIPEVDAVDIELDSSEIAPEVAAAAKRAGTFVIVSHHDFTATPKADELDEIVARARALGADHVKIAAWADSMDDTRTLAAFTLRHADDGVIVIAMSEYGTLSRVFFPLLGSRLTYAFGQGEPVPGQLSFAETVEMIRRFYPAATQATSGSAAAG